MSALVSTLLCVFIILGLHTSDVAASNLRCYKGSFNNFDSTQTSNPSGIMDCIDVTKKIRVFTHGFNATENGPAITGVMTAFIELGDNAILLDWVEESKASTNLEYPLVVIKAMGVADEFAKAIIYFVQHGIPLSLFHLTGHSVGAHIMGMAADKTKNKGYTIKRVDGLDPAGPFFGSVVGFKSISASQADYVQVSHFNPGAYGISRSVGDADFWANCGNNGVQPACDTGATGYLNDDDSCSHNLAWKVYIEVLKSPFAIPAAAATSCSDWKNQTNATSTNYYGESADQSKTGNFYFSTNLTPPYAKGQSGITPN